MNNATTVNAKLPTNVSPDLRLILLFVGSVAALYIGAFLSSKKSTARFRSFSRIYALLCLGGLAVASAFASLDANTKAAVFALIGTLAGYLAGARVTDSAEPEKRVEGTPQTGTTPSLAASNTDLLIHKLIGDLRPQSYSDI